MIDKVQFGFRVDISLDEASRKRKTGRNVNPDQRIKDMPIRKQ